MSRLTNQIAIITGGNAGIGAATSRLFAKEGASVVIAARNLTTGGALVEQITSEGGVAHLIQCDVRDSEQCMRVAEQTVARFGRIDILFNNAGIVPLGTILETSAEMWADVFATNVTGTFYMSRAVLPVMITQGQGVIVNNSSDWGIVGGQGAAAYSATKGAVSLLTKSMAIDHARQGIRVNAVCPGDTYVQRWDEWLPAGESRESSLAQLGEGFPLGRIGRVEEIANAVLFLASSESSYMTGHLLVVDGGNTAGGTAARFGSA
jgi:NAD(P)-dependent dehydrogenase (short-subunit alcohol dehydrogenase family)